MRKRDSNNIVTPQARQLRPKKLQRIARFNKAARTIKSYRPGENLCLDAMLACISKSSLTLEDAVWLRLEPLNGDQTAAETKQVVLDASYRIPYFQADGTVDPNFYRLRRLMLPDASPETVEYYKAPENQKFKYWQKPSSINRVFMPPPFFMPDNQVWTDIQKEPRTPLYWVEGEKKAVAMCKAGYITGGIGGVWSWSQKKKIDTPMVPDLMAFDMSNERDNTIVFDSDSNSNINVRNAQMAFARELVKVGGRVYYVTIPPSPTGEKMGADDFLQKFGQEAFDQLVSDRNEFDFSEKLWALNARYGLLDDPKSVALLDSATGTLLNLHHFRLRESNNLILEKDGLTGRMREIFTVDRWLKWDLRRTFSTLIYEPQAVGADIQLEDGSYNQWTGWGAEPIRNDEARRIFVDLLIGNLTRDSTEAERKWLLQWLAFPIQNAGTKLVTAAIIYGVQGSGKTMLGQWLKQIYGEPNFYSVKQHELFSPHNTYAANRQLIVGEEIGATDKRDHQAFLQELITQDTNTINPKYINPYKVKDHSNWIFLSDQAVPLALSPDDRRFGVYSPKTKLSEADKDLIGNMYRSKAGRDGLLYYLKEQVDLSDFKTFSDPPLSVAKRQLLIDARTNPEQFILHCIENYSEVFSIGGVATECDFVTARNLAAMYNARLSPGQRGTSTGAISQFLAKLALSGKVYRFERALPGAEERVWVFRNIEKWKRDGGSAEATRHWQESSRPDQVWLTAATANLDEQAKEALRAEGRIEGRAEMLREMQLRSATGKVRSIESATKRKPKNNRNESTGTKGK